MDLCIIFTIRYKNSWEDREYQNQFGQVRENLNNKNQIENQFESSGLMHQSTKIVFLCVIVLVGVVSVTEGQVGSSGCSRKWAPAGWCWRYCSGSSGNWCYTGRQGPCETATCVGGSCSGISCRGAAAGCVGHC
ncbi:hypothetical protein Fcan01_28166 [Folsomia candida]|uniref:Uncharacterized protein n=1 Tax=Folsomia candida TaxID=158441 RepID=A0A226CX59_FOLCA|nr:hypothetical protein Fcan01_28166 [Folsomia candida]